MSKDDSSVGKKEFRFLSLMMLFGLKYYFQLSNVLVILAITALVLGHYSNLSLETSYFKQYFML